MTTPLLFVDLETTGLDPRARYAGILEIGLRLVSPDLEVLAARSWVVPYPEEWIRTARAAADEPVREMHDASGLWTECADRAFVDADHPFVDALRWVRTLEARDVPLAGSSVHFDRGWLDRHLPRLLEGRTYRLVDVSSTRETLARFGPAGHRLAATRPSAPVKAHRVDPDLDASLAELRHYRDAIAHGLVLLEEHRAGGAS